MGSFIFLKQLSRYLHLNFEKEVIFLGRFSLMKFQKMGTKLLFKYLFSNISCTAWSKESVEPILDRKFEATETGAQFP